MDKMLKFGGQMEATTLKALKLHSKESGIKLSTILTEAARQYLRSHRVRPQFEKAIGQSLAKYNELYKRLAK